jgi:outer membrane protein OmpA-like peptidoglycan-associated protein
MKKIVFPLFILSFSLPIFSQNLIKNGNMENISASYPCQYAKEGFWFPKAINDWYSDIFVTADPLYYASNRPNCFPVKPHSGRTMAGIIAYHPYMDSGYNYDYHEIIGGAFVQPLIIGQTYALSFWLYADDSIGYKHLSMVIGKEAKKIYNVHIDSIGFRLSSHNLAKNIHCSKLNNNKKYAPQLQIALSQNDTSKGKWQQYKINFVADSAYRFFAFGNFKADSCTKSSLAKNISNQIDKENLTIVKKDSRGIFFGKTKRVAYYAVDDFVCETIENKPAPIILSKTQAYTFKNLLFSTGKSEILAISYSELNELTKNLVAMPKNTTIEINGYTDNIGNDKTNLLLSQKRADAIANYLIKNGLENKNIITKGYGSNFNIAPNDTETNRALNRRVEVKIK